MHPTIWPQYKLAALEQRRIYKCGACLAQMWGGGPDPYSLSFIYFPLFSDASLSVKRCIIMHENVQKNHKNPFHNMGPYKYGGHLRPNSLNIHKSGPA